MKMPYTRTKVNSYFLETTLRVTSFFAFFLHAHRARAKKVVWKSARPPYANATTKSLATWPPPPGAWPA
jgi:hypothetical protein